MPRTSKPAAVQVFVSWSGQGNGRSKAYAEAVHDFLRDLSDALRPWKSDRDINPGEGWFESIGKSLAKSSVVLVCLTQEAGRSPWLIFEAGAGWNRLANGKEVRVVVPLIFEGTLDLDHPMCCLQSCEVNEEPLKRTLLTLVQRFFPQDRELEERLKRRFKAYWPEFAERIGKIREPSPETTLDDNGGDKLPKPDPTQTLESLIVRFESAISSLERGGPWANRSNPEAPRNDGQGISITAVAALKEAASGAFSRRDFAAARDLCQDLKVFNPGSLKPIIDGARALVRLKARTDGEDLNQAISELDAGLVSTAATEKDYARQACAHWNMACYRVLAMGLRKSAGRPEQSTAAISPEVRQVMSSLRQAIERAPSYWEDLDIDPDLEFLRSFSAWSSIKAELRPEQDVGSPGNGPEPPEAEEKS